MTLPSKKWKNRLYPLHLPPEAFDEFSTKENDVGKLLHYYNMKQFGSFEARKRCDWLIFFGFQALLMSAISFISCRVHGVEQTCICSQLRDVVDHIRHI